MDFGFGEKGWLWVLVWMVVGLCVCGLFGVGLGCGCCWLLIVVVNFDC